VDDSPRRSRRRRSRSALVVLSLLCLLALAAIGWLLLDVREADRLDAERNAALQAARQQAVNLTSISHRDAARDIDRILEGATGELEEQFRSERDALTQLLGTTRSTSEGNVLAAGVVALEGRSATVLVATNATVTTAETGEDAPVLQRYRMSLDLRKVGDRWLVERILFAGAPS
jgi:Mce-associated membrane protein